MSVEQQDPEHEPTSEDCGNKKGSLWPILIGIFSVVVIVAVATFVLQGRRAAAEQQATQQLKDMGAFPHSHGGHTDSLAMALPGVKDNLAEAMPLVPKLVYLKTFNANTTDISDSHLVHVGSLTKLINLLLSDTPITDTGLQELAGLSNLESLYLANTLITSTSVPMLAKLRSLKVLDISGTRISGGLEPLIQLDQLEVLIADDLELSDADVEAISQIPKLKLLYVTESEISEEGLQKLRDTVRQVKFGGGETTLELPR